MGADYFIIVEEEEFEKYAEVINPMRILVLDKKCQKRYDPCDALGDNRSKGSGAARNFAWEHSIKEGYDYHWVMDDNIDYFFRLNNNRVFRVKSPVIFKWMEDFVLRYKNIGMAGPNYQKFVMMKSKDVKPVTWNTRIYSCNLIKNDLPFRWRGRYNEDTILSIDILKAGYCTVLFNAFLQEKKTTQTVKGGNMDEIYKDGTLSKSKMLEKIHPEICKLTWKFSRWHHECNYKLFTQKPIKKENIKIEKGVVDNSKLVKLPPEVVKQIRRGS